MTNEGLSLVDVAEIVLRETKEPLDLYALYDAVCERKNIKPEDKDDIVSQFYADITVSAKFVYTGDNMWDIKSNQKIELWEKDGSFYKEYTEVVIPEEYLEKEVKKTPEPKVSKAKAATPVVEEVVEEAKVEEVVVEEVKVEETVKPEANDTKTTVEPVVGEKTGEASTEEYEEELFDDFDEDKYNEYMDTYEDQYED